VIDQLYLLAIVTDGDAVGASVLRYYHDVEFSLPVVLRLPAGEFQGDFLDNHPTCVQKAAHSQLQLLFFLLLSSSSLPTIQLPSASSEVSSTTTLATP